MAEYQKFTFAPIIDSNVEFTPRKKKKGLTEEDIEAARHEGFTEGEQSQLVIEQQKQNEILEENANHLRTIANLMQMILGQLATEAEELREDAVDVAMAAAKAISKEALNFYPDATIKEYLKEAAANLRNTPRIIVRIPQSINDRIGEELTNLARDAGFEGQIDIRIDEEIGQGDCAIEWQDGAIRHNHEEVIKAVEDTAKEWLKAANE